MAKSGSGGRSRRLSNGLVALSSAAVLGVYSAGYVRTRPAAARFALSAERRSLAPTAITEAGFARDGTAADSRGAAARARRAQAPAAVDTRRRVSRPAGGRRRRALRQRPINRRLLRGSGCGSSFDSGAEVPAAIVAPTAAGPVADVAPRRRRKCS